MISIVTVASIMYDVIVGNDFYMIECACAVFDPALHAMSEIKWYPLRV